MAVTTMQVFTVFGALLFMFIMLWIFVISMQRKNFLDTYAYTRGANSWTDNTTVNLVCDSSKEICMFRATQVCSGNNSVESGGANYEYSKTDPFSSGTENTTVQYGDFDPNTTVDLTTDMEKECNGNPTCAYKFSASSNPFPFGTCSLNSQLISTYTCIPKGGTCQDYLGNNGGS